MFASSVDMTIGGRPSSLASSAALVMLMALAAGCSGGQPNGAGGGAASGGGAGTGGGQVSGNGTPQASFVVSASSVAPLLPVSLDASASSDPDGDALTYAWSFGDGVRGGGRTIAHAFRRAGSYQVSLTVDDGKGGAATVMQTVTVTAGPAPGPAVDVKVRVRALGAGAVAGVEVRETGTGTQGVTDAAGMATLSLPQGVPLALTLRKAGYTSQVKTLTVPSGAPSAAVEAKLLPRDPVVSLADASAGGTVNGRLGAKLELPADGLRASNGSAVVGSVDVAVTPINLDANLEAFPGEFVGITPTGTSGIISSFGVVEYELSQGGQPLNLKPGASATVELPLVAGQKAAGVAVAVGETIPLWSLDEGTGRWVQEGTGTVVVNASAPTGMALRATVGHLSWWNADQLGDPVKKKSKCCIDGDADGMCDANGNAAYCWTRGTSNCPSDFGACPRLLSDLPYFSASAFVPPEGGDLDFQKDLGLYLLGYSPDFTMRGGLFVTPTAMAPNEYVIMLRPVGASGATPIDALPFDQMYELSLPGEIDTFSYDGTAGQLFFAQLSRQAGNTNCRGTLQLNGPTGQSFGPVDFGTLTGTGKIGRIGVKLPVSGTYTLVAIASAGTPCSYRLQLANAGLWPVVVDTAPADGQVGVTVGAKPSMRFSMPLRPNSVLPGALTLSYFDLQGSAKAVVGRLSLDGGDTVELTPDAGRLYGGLQYRLQTPEGALISLDGGNNTLATVAPGLAVTFSTAEDAPPSVVPAFRDQPEAFGLTSNELYAVTSSQLHVYRPGTGWLSPRQLQQGNGAVTFVQADAKPDVAALSYSTLAGAQARLVRAGSLGTPISLAPGNWHKVAVDGQGRMVVAYVAAGDAGTSSWVQHVVDGGTTAPQELVHRIFGQNNDSERPSVWANLAGDAVYTVAEYQTVNPYAVLYSAQTQTWGAPTLLATATAEQLAAGIDDNGNVLAVWGTASAIEARYYEVATGQWSTTLSVRALPVGNTNGDTIVVAPLPGGDFMVVAATGGGSPTKYLFAVRFAAASKQFGTIVDLDTGTGVPQMRASFDRQGNGLVGWQPPLSQHPGRYARFTNAGGFSAAVDLVSFDAGYPAQGGNPEFFLGPTNTAFQFHPSGGLVTKLP